MKSAELSQFPLSRALTMLNHASFGVVTTRVMGVGDEFRSELEADSHALVDIDALFPRMRHAATIAASQLGLDAASFALTQNATSGGSAVIRSMPLARGSRVVVLDTEYPSIVRGWQVRCAEVGAEVVTVSLPLPIASTESLIATLERDVRGPVAVAQLSLVSSSTAVHLPIEPIAAWFQDRGARIVLDAAHAPGHVPVDPARWGVSAMFGTLHKWFPTPRPVGFLWAGDDLREVIRPSVVSLTWDAAEIVERFEWPGTYDPVPRLCVPAALEQWGEWEASGALAECSSVAEFASVRLSELGAVPSCPPEMRAPRLRAFAVSVDRDVLRQTLYDAGVRAWTGLGPRGETMLRVATHVYNDESDVDRLCDVVAPLLRAVTHRTGGPGTTLP